MTPSGPDHLGTIAGDLVACWSCGRSVTQHALFCHKCGAMQPVRKVDPFSRLGLPPRFDIDLNELDRHYSMFRRNVDPERFTGKGARERSHAQAQADGLAYAYETLRNPLSRARHLLQRSGAAPAAAAPDLELQALSETLAQATSAPEIDRLAAQAGRGIEGCIRGLAAAFRAGDLDAAGREMVRLEQLESLAEAARARRAATPGA